MQRLCKSASAKPAFGLSLAHGDATPFPKGLWSTKTHALSPATTRRRATAGKENGDAYSAKPET